MNTQNEMTIDICNIVNDSVKLLALSLSHSVVFPADVLTVVITVLVGGVVGIVGDGDGDGDVLYSFTATYICMQLQSHT